jgi:hypothetical protein
VDNFFLERGYRRIWPARPTSAGQIEIDIWRAATLMLRRYGDKAEEQTAARAADLTTEGDHEGTATWRRITDAVRQLATVSHDNDTQHLQ